MRRFLLVVALPFLIVASSACAQQVAKTDLHGDPLPPGALARLGTVRLRHHDQITCLAVAPDGRIAASAGGSCPYNPKQPWKKLLSLEAEDVYDAISRLTVRPSESVPFLKDRLDKLAANPDHVKKDIHNVNLRLTRCIQVFEYIGSPEAKEAIRSLARLTLPSPADETVQRAIERQTMPTRSK